MWETTEKDEEPQQDRQALWLEEGFVAGGHTCNGNKEEEEEGDKKG